MVKFVDVPFMCLCHTNLTFLFLRRFLFTSFIEPELNIQEEKDVQSI